MRRVILILLIVSMIFTLSCSKKEEKKVSQEKQVELTVIFVSDLLGRIRSCGCSIQDMGGLGRMATYIEKVRAGAANMIAVDAGDDFTADISFSKNEAELIFDTYNLIGFDAFAPGELEYIFGLDYLLEKKLSSTFDFVSANVVDTKSGKPIFGKDFIVRNVEGVRVGITGVLDDSITFPSYIDRSGFRVLPVEETLHRVIPRMKRSCDFMILLSHLGLERSKELARKIQDFDVIVVGHKRPVIKKLERIGKTIIVATGGKGQYVGRLDLSLSSTGRLIMGRMRLVPLTDDIEVHPTVRKLFERYGLPITDKELKKRAR